MDLKEHILSNETIYQGRIFTVEQMQVRLPDGTTALRDVTRFSGAAAIVAYDGTHVLLVRQYRVTAQELLWELPAGRLEPGEDPLVCAQRELREETGATAAHWQKLCAAYGSPGCSDEVLHLYLARGLTAGDMQLDEGEFLQAHAVPLQRALAMIATGEIMDMKTIAGLTMLANIVDEDAVL